MVLESKDDEGPIPQKCTRARHQSPPHGGYQQLTTFPLRQGVLPPVRCETAWAVRFPKFPMFCSVHPTAMRHRIQIAGVGGKWHSHLRVCRPPEGVECGSQSVCHPCTEEGTSLAQPHPKGAPFIIITHRSMLPPLPEGPLFHQPTLEKPC